MLSWWANESDIKYTPVPDISTFAVLYVLAQGIERVVEVLIAVIDGVATRLSESKFAEARKRTALSTLKAEGSPAVSHDDTEKAAKDLDAARADLTLVSQGLSFALAIVSVSYFHYGAFASIGVAGVDAPVDRVFTALAIMGGAKGLHDLISKVQKSKEKEEKKA